MMDLDPDLDLDLDLPPDAMSASECNAATGIATTLSSAPDKVTRAPVACKRCRRLRSKCRHENSTPPCLGCLKAGPGIAAECIFPPRGAKDDDRQFRQPRATRSYRSERDRASGVSPIPSNLDHADKSPLIFNTTFSPGATSHRDLLPPYEEVVQGCKVFSTSYFQLGFMPKAIFLERLAKDYESVSVFLLLSILSVSARFTPSLVQRYRGCAKATEYFITQAARLVPDEMYRPTLDRTQAFFLLAIAEWGNGDKDRCSIHMGIAVTMASILCLHREETYSLPPDATADEVVDSEMARRTFWIIESQNNLHSGYSTPYSFALSDITAQLPCDETDFAFGIIPRERAVLFGTQAAAANPALVSTPSRSLFASLIQAHNLWGQVARRACRSERELTGAAAKPWESMSEYSQLSDALHRWEEDLPARHRWSIRNLRGYKAESLDLAYLAIVMVLRLSNIVVRRIYLQDIILALQGTSEVGDGAPPNFWGNMSNELFENVLGLHEQIDAYLPLRSREEGFPAIIVFCVYICGSLASYLRMTPQLCPHLGSRAETILHSSLNALTKLQYAWPMAIKWQQALHKVAASQSEAHFPSLRAKTPREHLANSPVSRRLSLSHMPIYRISSDFHKGRSNRQNVEASSKQIPDDFRHHSESRSIGPITPRALIDTPILEIPTTPNLAVSHVANHTQSASNELFSFMGMENPLPIDNFEAELTAFLQGELQYETWDQWDRQ